METSTVESPIGVLSITVIDRVLRRIEFEGRAGGAALHSAGARAIARRLQSYFEGDLQAIDALAAEPDGTPFQRLVWRRLREIPAGRTWTYSALARAIGRADAVRAVGAANAANPIPIVIPCHRVIGADGRLVGYGGGLDRKLWLLTHEGCRLL